MSELSGVMKQALVTGFELEKGQQFERALEYWASCAQAYPDVCEFPVRAAGIALRLKLPERAEAFLSLAENAGDFAVRAEQAAVFRERIPKLKASLLRTSAKEAFDSNDFDLSEKLFAELLSYQPENETAQRYHVRSMGLSSSFSDRLLCDLPKVKQRFFVMGCGRSGTWMLTAMLHCFEGFRIAPGEQPLGTFLQLPDLPEVQVVKRQSDAYLHADKIPDHVKVIYIARHPFDVLTSTHVDKENYISLERYETELAAYFRHLRARPGTLTLRYEDLVKKPAKCQRRIEKFIGQKVKFQFSEFHQHADLAPDVVASMHGLRAPDPKKINAWRRKTDQFDYMRNLLQMSDGTLSEVAGHFGYDLSVRGELLWELRRRFRFRKSKDCR